VDHTLSVDPTQQTDGKTRQGRYPNKQKKKGTLSYKTKSKTPGGKKVSKLVGRDELELPRYNVRTLAA